MGGLWPGAGYCGLYAPQAFVVAPPPSSGDRADSLVGVSGIAIAPYTPIWWWW